MRRKNLMTAIIASFCLMVSALAPAGISMAEEGAETETAAEETAADETQAEESDAEEAAEAESGTEAQEDGTEASQETEAVPERPDYNALDNVTLGEYTGLTVTIDLSVTEEEVDQTVNSNIKSSVSLETVEEGTVEEGDTVNIDYEGKLDGVAFDGGTDKGYDLEIGSHTFIDGFEEGLVGVSTGETVDIPLTFPENYFSEDLAGQDVVFTVTVNEIKRVPELTDELASTLSEGAYTDAASYRESIRQELETEKESQRESMIHQEILTQVANTCTIDSYPQELVDYSVDNTVSYYQSMAEAYGMDLADFLTAYLGITEEQLREEAALSAQQNMQAELYLKAIAEQEGIQVTDEEFQTGAEEYAQQYGFESAEDLIAYYGEGMIDISLLQDKVMDFLMENTTVEEASAQSEGSTEEVSEGSAQETEAAQ